MPLSLLSVPALLHNYRLLAEKTAGTLIPVVKANAYGHGAMPVVRALLGEGASLFAVASAAEAKELLPLFHENIPKNDNQRFTNIGVLIMGPAEDEAVLPLMRGRAVFAVHSLPYARRLCALLSKEKKNGKLPTDARLPVHLKLDTGMHRLGLAKREELLSVLRLPHLAVCGVYSHLACARSKAQTEEQLFRFRALLHAAPALSRIDPPPLLHLSAGEALLRYGDLSLSGARAGLSLYGVPPKGMRVPLLPVLRFYARVLAVRRVLAGEQLGYGSLRLQRDVRIAVLDAGYADGIPPTAENGGYVTLWGRRCPFVGSVCMDRSFLEIGTLPVCEGMLLPLFGTRVGDTAALAESAGVSPYVLLCLRSARTERRVRYSDE